MAFHGSLRLIAKDAANEPDVVHAFPQGGRDRGSTAEQVRDARARLAQGTDIKPEFAYELVSRVLERRPELTQHANVILADIPATGTASSSVATGQKAKAKRPRRR